MPNYNPIITDALKAHWADDTEGPTETKSFRIEVDMLQWLASLDGSRGVAKHVRQALREYQERIERKS